MRIVAVVGPGRSGTSLLQAFLASHPEVAGLQETGILRSALLSDWALTSPASWVTLRDWALSHPRIQRWNLAIEEVEACARKATSVTPNASYQRMYIELATQMGRNFRKPVVVDKDPRLIEVIPRVGEAVVASPVLIVRNPRDILASRMKTAWSAHQTLPRQVAAMTMQMRGAVALVESGRATGFVALERLVRNTSDELRTAFRLAGLRYTSVSTNTRVAAAKRLMTASEREWKRRTLAELSSTASSTDQVSEPFRIGMTVIEQMNRPYFDVFGYERSEAGFGVALSSVARLMEVIAIQLEMHKVRRRFG